MTEKLKLSGVPETMLQTVYARAKESRTRGAIHDAKAEEIISRLDYDFSLADRDAPMLSCSIAYIFTFVFTERTVLYQADGILSATLVQACKFPR